MHLPQYTSPSAAVEAQASYSVAVTLCGRDPSVLLALVSVLHRRGVDVLTARLTEPVADSRRFDATISTTARQARTVAATLGNLVHVTDVQLAPVRRLTAVAHESAG